MDVDLLQQIVKLMAANDLNTVDVRDGDRRIILKRGPNTPMVVSMPTMAAPMAGNPGANAASPPPVDEEAELKPIKSPMVGTFYAAPAPDAKAFVNVGSKVDEETDVCVIEAMKVFNNIKAERAKWAGRGIRANAFPGEISVNVLQDPHRKSW